MRRPGLAPGLLLGVVLDTMLADPARGHPVAAFGAAAARVERLLWADSRARGALFALACVGPLTAAARAADLVAARWGAVGRGTAGRGAAGRGTAGQVAAGRGAAGPSAAGPSAAGRAALAGQIAWTALAAWTVLGGESLASEAIAIARALEAGDLATARRRLPALCGRDPAGLDGPGIARAVVESVAENTCDAVVAPLLWGAACGVPGLVGYRAVNTLDAMVGHRDPRYGRFGWAAARLDDVANLAPARLTALLAAVLAPAVGGSLPAAFGVLRRDGGNHPSPNAGRCEAAFAGALRVRLGGTNVYAGVPEQRGPLGAGRAPGPRDIRRAVLLARLTGAVAAVLAAAAAAVGPSAAGPSAPGPDAADAPGGAGFVSFRPPMKLRLR